MKSGRVDPKSQSVHQDAMEDGPMPDLKGKTFLIIEDSPSNYSLMSRMLEYMGARCLWKNSGREVTEFMRTSGEIDLIFMDLRLPHEDGYTALGRIRATEELRDTPVVAVTAYASEEEMQRADKAGFDGFLGKPLTPDRFPHQVSRMLSGRPVWELE